ncbi:hypothetical protein H2198_004185 [Neophaeococcomyces mojaviensis]|uniref:Uncharacterized protein n=1 Tax=Neophaeococcomyces mojaviensis TaxID=3383035 RepID=A0ACC3A9L6_9EURO|nr:hypothetical protein H2198_004185 [Knufia sp. JES_112]
MADPLPADTGNKPVTNNPHESQDVVDENGQADEAVDDNITRSTDINVTRTAEDLAEGEEIEDVEVESEEAKQDWKLLCEAKSRLRALPPDHQDIPKVMLSIVNHMADYHVSARIVGEGQLIHALDIASEAEGLAPSDDFWRGSAIYSQMAVCYTLYKQTKNIDWLRQGVELGSETVKFMQDREDDINPVFFRVLYSGKCERLSEGFKMLYDVEAEPTQIEKAVRWQGISVDSTEPDDYQEDGLGKRYWRFKLWCDLWVRLMDVRDDLALSGVIHLAAEHHPCDIRNKEMRSACSNFFNVLALECRQWAITRNPEHLKAIYDRTKDLLKSEAEDRSSDTEPPKYAYDAENPKHVIRRAAKFFDWYYDVEESESSWSTHLRTIETAIALWEQVHAGIGRETLDDLQEDMYPVLRIRDLYWQKYRITNVATDGWRYDDLNYESTNMNVTIQMLGCVQGETKRIDQISEGSSACTIGSSVVTGQTYTIWSSTPATLVMDMGSQRFKFLRRGDDGPPTIEDWISGRTDDGKFILGGAIRGRDDDVFEFLRSYSSKPIPIEKGGDGGSSREADSSGGNT